MPTQRTNFLIIHGTLGNPQSHWFPWLKKQLEDAGHRVATPVFPTPDNQSLDSWRAVAAISMNDFNASDSILIGHSIGAAFALRLAEHSTTPYKALFLIAPFISRLGLEPYDTLNATFVQPVFDGQRIRRNAKMISCFAGDDDPYVPLPYAKEVADLCAAPLTVIEKGGHLNSESGYLEFPLLHDKIRHTLSS